MKAMGFSERSTFGKNYLRPALEAGAIERTIPDKPKSRLQKYRRARPRFENDTAGSGLLGCLGDDGEDAETSHAGARP